MYVSMLSVCLWLCNKYLWQGICLCLSIYVIVSVLHFCLSVSLDYVYCVCVCVSVVLQLESSGKWPSELAAISHIKTSFYSYLAKALQQQCHLQSSPALHHLDVLKVTCSVST